MAIDTAEKRKSVAGIPFLPLGVGVTPNASKDQEWRQQAAWSYSGILAGLPVVVGTLVGQWANVITVAGNLSRIECIGNESSIMAAGNMERIRV